MNAHAGPGGMRPEYLGYMNGVERVAFKALRYTGKSKPIYRLFESLHRGLPALAKFRNRHAGERCFILGGGPSLKKIDPTPLRNEITFGVNGVFLIYDWLGFEPSYYIVEDFLVFEDRWRDIMKRVLRSTCFFPVQFRHPDFDRGNHVYFRAIYVPGA